MYKSTKKKHAASKHHAVKESSSNEKTICQPLPWGSVVDDSSDFGSDSYTYIEEQKNRTSYGQVEEFRVKMHHDWESSQEEGRNYFVGYKGDSFTMHR